MGLKVEMIALEAEAVGSDVATYHPPSPLNVAIVSEIAHLVRLLLRCLRMCEPVANIWLQAVIALRSCIADSNDLIGSSSRVTDFKSTS